MSALIKREIIYMTKNNLETTKSFPDEERLYELLSVWNVFIVSPLPCFLKEQESKKNMADLMAFFNLLDWQIKFSEIQFPGFWS